MLRKKAFNEKYLVVTADDFGMDCSFNDAVLEAFQNGFLTSACICANGKAFDDAIMRVIPSCPELGVGVHLNIVEGKTINPHISRTSALYNSDGTYRNGFVSLLINSSSDKLLQEIEVDFRFQIEKILEYISPDHINSHVHIHAVPAIFNIVCRLAEEYNIPFIRTQQEKPYVVPDFSYNVNKWYPVNLAKVFILNKCTYLNKKSLLNYNLNTNNYLIGVGYTGHMDSKTIEYALDKIDDTNCLVEILLHPCKFNLAINEVVSDQYKKSRITEFYSLMDGDLLSKINYSGWILSNFKQLA